MGHLSMEVRTEVLCGRICDLEDENAKLLKELEAEHALAETLGHYHEDAKSIIVMLSNARTENACLLERITTQKQTIQAYRDESREWREVAERAQAENARLRELAKGLYEFAYAEYPRAAEAGFADDLRELGIEMNK